MCSQHTCTGSYLSANTVTTLPPSSLRPPSHTGFTFPGDVVVTDHKHPSHAPATELDTDLLALYLRELGCRGRDLAPAIAAAGATSGSGGGGASSLTVSAGWGRRQEA
jgi:hypothetical protein